MKHKRALKALLLSVTAVILCVSLAGCMKIGMREDNVLKRLTDEGYTNKIISVTPWLDGFIEQKIALKKVVLSKKQDGESELAVFVQICLDDKSADWVEEKCEAYVPQIYENPADAPENYVNTTDFRIYRYDFIVLFGDFKSMSVARGY